MAHEADELLQRRAELAERAQDIMDRSGGELTEEEDKRVNRLLERCKVLREKADDAIDEREALRSRLERGVRGEETNMTDDNGDGLPSFGGAGKHFGYDKRGREIRSFRAADSMWQFRKDRDGFSDFWEEAANPLGKFLRAKAVGPQDAWERRALSSTAGSGDLIPEPIRLRTLDDLKAQSVLGRAGAQFVNMTSASLAITRVDNPASHSWAAEGTTAATTDMNFAVETLSAETLRGIHKANEELVQDAPDFPRVLQAELIGSLQAELQRVAFVGSGSGSEPQGLYGSTSITKIDFGGSTSGTAPASSGAQWDEILRARETLLNANQPDNRQSFVWAPRTEKQFASLKDGNHQPLMKPAALDNVRQLVTTSVPTTLAPGSLTGQSAVFYGRYPHMVVGMRLDPMVRVLRERYAENYRLGFLSALRADVVTERPSAFTVIDRVST